MKKLERIIIAVAALSVTVAMTQIPIAAFAMEDSEISRPAGEDGLRENVSGVGEGVSAGISQNEAARGSVTEENLEGQEGDFGGMPETTAAQEETASTTSPRATAEPTEIAPTTPPAENTPTEKPVGTASPLLPEGTIPTAEPVDIASVSITVPIYDYDIVDIVVPTSYALALNPHGLSIGLGDGTVSEAQVVSRNYGIINKSTRDKIVTVHLTIEDMNGGKIAIVDSAEEAMNADADTYALYLEAVSADESGIRLGNAPVDENTSAESLANVNMTKAEKGAVVLKAGENSFSFRLSKAVYGFEGGNITLADTASQSKIGQFQIKGLADDGRGVTAFTFNGVMNPRADWFKLSGGLKFTVVYTYQDATGDEKIIEGTGAMVEP